VLTSGLMDLAEEILADTRTGQNSRHTLIALWSSGQAEGQITRSS